MAGQKATEPIQLGEKTATVIRDAETLREQARAMFAQAEARIEGVAVAWREARGLPDSWQLTKAPDGRYFMADQAPPPEPAVADVESGAGPIPEPGGGEVAPAK